MTYPGGNFGGGTRLAWPPLTPIVKHLLIINVVVFVATFALSWSDTARIWTRDLFALSPGLWRQWFPVVPFWQLITANFLHDLNGLGHLAVNMLLLYFFGTRLESTIGGRRFLFTYLAAGLAGYILQLTVALVTGSSIPALGASGAVLGILVACAVLHPNDEVLVIFIPVKLKYLAAFYVILDVFSLLVQARDGGSGGVAHWVHLGGAAYGGIVAWRKWIYADPVDSFERKREARKVAQAVEEDQHVDDLLAKISREGIQSLSKREREFLKRHSERKNR